MRKMFEHIELAPADPILGLTEAFNNDNNPEKINLTVGVFKDENGKTPILNCVKKAQERLFQSETTKGYKPIPGAPEYAAAVQKLLFGEGHKIVTEKRAVTAHTPGGTGALRVVADYLHRLHPETTVWLSDPTWANHPQIFRAAAVPTKTYAYFDASSDGLDFDALIKAVESIPAGDAILLHGCCHNPTGVDPNVEQWSRLAKTLAKRKVIPLVDFAYQGFGTSLEEDAQGLHELCKECEELFVCSSFSKNFGLYNERVGAATVVANSSAEAQAVFSHIKIVIRTNYSNPPAHGAGIVTEILGDPELRAEWDAELAGMRDRINGIRARFVAALQDADVPGDYSFITRQNGMFSFSGLNKHQVERLRKEFSVYIVGSGRINVAGMTDENITPLCSAIKAVL